VTGHNFPTVALVHGAFSDAAGFTGMIGELSAAGIDVVAPPTPLRGVAIDAAVVAAVVNAISGPVLLVGHSYGGAVISQASAGLPNVVGLVYFAAYAPAVGESCASSQEPFPPTMLLEAIRPSPYEAIGAEGGPELLIDRARFREAYCADVPVDVAEVMAATQRPLAAVAIGEPLSAVGWISTPTWYQVATRDMALAPEAQRFMADRMLATVEEIDASHAAFVAHPVAAAELVLRALNAVA
jgi:pimeloyl-ACP methyl ester carboxylesterase